MPLDTLMALRSLRSIRIPAMEFEDAERTVEKMSNRLEKACALHSLTAVWMLVSPFRFQTILLLGRRDAQNKLTDMDELHAI